MVSLRDRLNRLGGSSNINKPNEPQTKPHNPLAKLLAAAITVTLNSNDMHYIAYSVMRVADTLHINVQEELRALRETNYEAKTVCLYCRAQHTEAIPYGHLMYGCPECVTLNLHVNNSNLRLLLMHTMEHWKCHGYEVQAIACMALESLGDSVALSEDETSGFRVGIEGLLPVGG